MSGDDTELVALRVDTEACIGGGQCEMLAPEVFEVDDDTGIAAVIGTGRLPRSRALEVVERCPGRAIAIVED